MSWTSRQRRAAIDEIAETLPQRSSRLGRLLWRHARGRVPRGMASVLARVEHEPQTVGRLAEAEGVSQPTMTRMVGRLTAEGLVERRGDPTDARVVYVAITAAGAAELDAVRERYRALLRDRLAGATDEQLDELLCASEALERLVGALTDGET